MKETVDTATTFHELPACPGSPISNCVGVVDLLSTTANGSLLGIPLPAKICLDEFTSLVKPFPECEASALQVLLE